MATNLQTSSDESVPSLMAGIVHDVGELFKQQVELVKTEVKADVSKAKEAAASLALGLCFVLLSATLLCFTLVYLLNEFGGLPLWASFLIVTVLVGLPGVGLAFYGWKKFQSVTPEQSVQAIKETLEWQTNPK
jgi:F0F1-type ATP synthase assembly protein I